KVRFGGGTSTESRRLVTHSITSASDANGPSRQHRGPRGASIAYLYASSREKGFRLARNSIIEGTHMNKLIAIGSMGIVCLSAAACNQAKSPADAQRDVSKAEQNRAAKVDEARKEGDKSIERQQKDVNAQQRDVASARRDVNDAAANKNYEVAIAKADGD